MENKKTIKKIKSATKNVTNKTGVFFKKTGKRAGEIRRTLEKQWEKEKPQREKLKKSANRALENSVKISGDVFKTIKKDIKQIRKQKTAKK